MNEYIQGLSIPFDTILRYWMVILGIIFAIIFAKMLASFLWNAFKKANFLKTLFEKIWVSVDLNTLWNIVSKATYFIIIFIILVGILKYLDIEIKLINDILDNFLPKLINATWLAIVAWFLATIAKTTITKIDLTNKIWAENNVSESLWIIAYWSIIIFFLPQILEKLGQDKLLEPINNIINSITSYIPNIIWATIIFVLGIFIAKILKQITVSVLDSFKIDKISKKLGLNDLSISKLAWTLVYILILVPVTIQALDKLKIEVISKPAIKMLEQLMEMIPLLLTAWIIIFVSYFIWKFISKLVSELLAGIWFDKILKLLWFKKLKSEIKASDVVWKIIFYYILLLAIVEASNTIWFSNIANIVNNIIIFTTNVLIWVLVFGIWLFLANLVWDAIKSTSNSKVLSLIAKVAIITLTSFMWLQQIWIGWEIINQAFTLLLGSIAVAFALAVWLWAKDVAWEEVKRLIEKLKK